MLRLENEPLCSEIITEPLEEVGLAVEVAEDGTVAVTMGQHADYALIRMEWSIS